MTKENHYPDMQPFNIKGKKNLTKKNSWWQRNPPQNNVRPKGEKHESLA